MLSRRKKKKRRHTCMYANETFTDVLSSALSEKRKKEQSRRISLLPLPAAAPVEHLKIHHER